MNWIRYGHFASLIGCCKKCLEKRTMHNTSELATGSEASVYSRYASAAQQVEPALCCPVEYNPEYLKVIPQEVIERDYGCGDPSGYVQPGEVVLDLGSGGGKLCFIAAQVVGPAGRIIGVDCNRQMLALARKHAPTVASRIGFANTDFRYGMIQDLQLDLELLEDELTKNPVRNSDDFLQLRQRAEVLRAQKPLVEDQSVDCVISNCVLNLVRQQDRQQLFTEIFRVLRDGGRAAISDIVSDQTVPLTMINDPELWSGCISGAFREDEFLLEFEKAGFFGIQIVKRSSRPWKTINEINFRSITIVAYKTTRLPKLNRNQSVIYRGPFKSVVDDLGQTYFRGQPTDVCETTCHLLSQRPYASMFESTQARENDCCQPSMDSSATAVVLPQFKGGCGVGDSGCC
jgi:arsenite methyltransferase